MKVRYIGDDEGRLVPLPDGDTAHVSRREWLDTSPDHARSLAQSDEWELEAVVKAKRTRKAHAKGGPVPESQEAVLEAGEIAEPDDPTDPPAGEENDQ